jgi:hypothetical protein
VVKPLTVGLDRREAHQVDGDANTTNEVVKRDRSNKRGERGWRRDIRRDRASWNCGVLPAVR